VVVGLNVAVMVGVLVGEGEFVGVGVTVIMGVSGGVFLWEISKNWRLRA